MNPASELLAALEKDEEKALELFFQEWEVIVRAAIGKRVEMSCCIRLRFPAQAEGEPKTACCLCPIIAVYMYRFNRILANNAYTFAGYALGLSGYQTKQIVQASDGWGKPDHSYLLRLRAPFQHVNQKGD